MASAVAAPRPDSSPAAPPSASVRRIQSTPIGPTGAAMENPITRPLSRKEKSIVDSRRTAQAPLLRLDTSVYSDYASAQVVVLAALEADVLHHRLEGLLIWMDADRLGQISEPTTLARHQPPNQRPDVERVEVVEGGEPREWRMRELQNDGWPSWPEHPEHRAKHGFLAGYVAHPEADGGHGQKS